MQYYLRNVTYLLAHMVTNKETRTMVSYHRQEPWFADLGPNEKSQSFRGSRPTAHHPQRTALPPSKIENHS